MGRDRQILQIVGYQNSGKTTLMERLISQSVTAGLAVGTIKHHGHGGVPTGDNSKDSSRHEQAGASVTAVEGAGTLRMSIHRKNWALTDILAIYDTFNMDAILIEGYKKEPYPKVVLLRTSEDRELLEKLSNIVCVIYWPAYRLDKPLEYPAFSIHDEAQYMEFLMTEIRGK